MFVWISRCLKLVCLFVCIKLLESISKINSGPKDINHDHHHEDFKCKYRNKYLFSFSNLFCYIQLVAVHPLVVSRFGCKLNRRPKYVLTKGNFNYSAFSPSSLLKSDLCSSVASTYGYIIHCWFVSLYSRSQSHSFIVSFIRSLICSYFTFNYSFNQ